MISNYPASPVDSGASLAATSVFKFTNPRGRVDHLTKASYLEVVQVLLNNSFHNKAFIVSAALSCKKDMVSSG